MSKKQKFVGKVHIKKELDFDVFCDMIGINTGDHVYHILIGKVIDLKQGVAEINGRLTVTPKGLKKLWFLLDQHVKIHEEKFGEIKTTLAISDSKGRITIHAPKEEKRE